MDNIAPGQQLGPYRIINQIGQGGMATVYKAYHAAMDRYVAIKVLPSQFAQQKEFVQRFEQEARTIAKLEHAHILPVYDYGEHNGIAYLVMRYLDAGTLKDKIAVAPLSLNEVDALFTQLASALAYAHDMGIVHRDIKPSNAMVNSRGELFLTDFGIAKLLESSAHLTMTGSITGTPAYMSPEQAQGDTLDLRSDIYSLGIVLYEMVTGKVPFEAETPLAVILKQISGRLPPPTTLKPDLDPEIERVILKSLAKVPQDRFATCHEFLNAWKTALTQTQTARVTTPSTVEMKAAAPTISPPLPPAAAPTVSAPESSAVPRKKKVAARKGISRGWLWGGLGALALMALCFFIVLAIQINAPNTPTAMSQAEVTSTRSNTATLPAVTATIIPTAQSNSATPPSIQAMTLPTAPPAQSSWTSWWAMNNIRAMAVKGDRIIAGGPTGFGFWSEAEGKNKEYFTMSNSSLPHSYVTVIFIDEDGSTWVGTAGGLLHITDKGWTTFKLNEGLDSDYITAIARVNKRLIVGTAYSRDGGGLNEFDPQTQTFTPIQFPSVQEDQKGQLSYNVTAIAADKSGTVWVATTNGLGRYDGKEWKRAGVDLGLPSDRLTSLLVDKQNRLWIGTEAGAATLTDNKFRAAGKTQGWAVYDMEQDAKDMIWFTGQNQVGRLDPSNETWTVFDSRSSGLPERNIISVALGEKDTLYFGTEGDGIARYGSDGKFTVWKTPNVPAANGFSRILTAPDGGLWFVEEYGWNVDRFDPASQKWTPTRSACDCEPLAFDVDGNLWGGTTDSGLWIVAKGGKVNITTQQGLPSNRITALVVGKDIAVVGTDKGLALIQDRKVTQTFTKEKSGFADKWIRAIWIASDKSIWVGTKGGVSRLVNGKWEHHPLENPLGDDRDSVTDIAESPDDSIWVTAAGHSIGHYKDGKWQRYALNDPDLKMVVEIVRGITVAPNGSVWFATSNGALRFDGKQWEAFPFQPQTFISPNVNNIYVSKSGEVFFATSAGVTRYKP